MHNRTPVIHFDFPFIFSANVPDNHALMKDTYQSSNFLKGGMGLGGSELAVDGNINTTCTHTNRDTQPWWVVDLGVSKWASGEIQKMTTSSVYEQRKTPRTLSPELIIALNTTKASGLSPALF